MTHCVKLFCIFNWPCTLQEWCASLSSERLSNFSQSHHLHRTSKPLFSPGSAGPMCPDNLPRMGSLGISMDPGMAQGAGQESRLFSVFSGPLECPAVAMCQVDRLAVQDPSWAQDLLFTFLKEHHSCVAVAAVIDFSIVGQAVDHVPCTLRPPFEALMYACVVSEQAQAERIYQCLCLPFRDSTASSLRSSWLGTASEVPAWGMVSMLQLPGHLDRLWFPTVRDFYC